MCCKYCCSRPEPVDEHELRATVHRTVTDFDFTAYDADVIATVNSMDARMQTWRTELIHSIVTEVMSAVNAT